MQAAKQYPVSDSAERFIAEIGKTDDPFDAMMITTMHPVHQSHSTSIGRAECERRTFTRIDKGLVKRIIFVAAVGIRSLSCEGIGCVGQGH